MSTPGGVRPASEQDLPAIVALYARVYPDRVGPSLEKRTAYMRCILNQHPWQSPSLPSLAYEDRAGRLVGFLGVLPRPMLANGRPIVMAVSHHFMVDPEYRATLAGVSLTKAFLMGSQDLSMCESDEPVRKIWHALGGTTALLQSPHWTRPLRPVRHMASLLRKRGVPAWVTTGLSPGIWALDKMAETIRQSPFRLPAGDCIVEAMDPHALLDHIETFSRGCFLRPVYDAPSLTWLLDILAAKREWGDLRAQVVRRAGDALGYYLYFAKSGGVSDVVQVGARRGAMADVLNALALDAREHGAVALTGRLDPRYVNEISGGSSFGYGSNWLLIHTRDANLERAIYKGDAFLTRLEGEWWLPFDDPDRGDHDSPR
jgi:hypothetical protein